MLRPEKNNVYVHFKDMYFAISWIYRHINRQTAMLVDTDKYHLNMTKISNKVLCFYEYLFYSKLCQTRQKKSGTDL